MFLVCRYRKLYRVSGFIFVQNVVCYFTKTKITFGVLGHRSVLTDSFGFVRSHREGDESRKQRVEISLWSGNLRLCGELRDNRPSVYYSLDVVLGIVENPDVGILLECVTSKLFNVALRFRMRLGTRNNRWGFSVVVSIFLK
jgi:hypothetical protein